jgi:hypothetical protein
MKNVKRGLAAAAALVVGTGFGAAWAAPGDVVVTPANLEGWQPVGAVVFEAGPGDPPCGDGSAEFRVSPAGADAAQLRTPDYHGVPLAAVDTLEYATYVEFNQSGQAVYLILGLDLDGDLVADDFLFFEPEYQRGYTANVPAQDDVALGVWQTWDARAGGWWSANGIAGAGPGADVKTIDQYLAVEPDATIVNTAEGLGGLRLVAGFGGPGDWGGFVGNADCLTIGVAGEATTYDFEAAAADEDGDGVPDADDHCPDSDTRELVDVNGDAPGGETSIENTTDDEGCTIQDDVDECDDTAKNHGQFVKCIGDLSRSLEDDGRITKEQGKEMRKAAAQSSVGKK